MRPRRGRKRFFRLPWRSAKQIRADVDEELAFHLDMRVESLIAEGLSRERAAAQALREFGDLDEARRYIGSVDRDIEAAQRRSELMHELWQDALYAIRKLRSAPAFTAAAIITLALGIGANTAIFSVVNAVLLKPLPFPQADHLMRFRFTQQGHGDAGTPMDLIDYRQAKTLVGVAAMEGATANLSREQGDAERILSARVSANWFDLLRVRPLYGRYFVRGEDDPSAPNVVVLSEELWRRDFSADTSIIGKALRINAQSFTVIGVVPAGLRYPITVELWMPKRFSGNELSDQSRGARWLAYLARIKDGVSVEAANAEVLRISQMMEKRFPEDFRERRARLTTLRDFLVSDMKQPLLIVLGAVLLVLLIACANVANLLLVRASTRDVEIAIRTALGAGRGRLIRQLITESVILSIVGAMAGVGIAKVGMALLLQRAPQSLTFVNRATIDGTTLALTALVAILTGLMFGTLPALQSVTPQLAIALRAGGRGARSRQGANRTKRTIVVAELALAVMLLSSAGLLLNSFARLISVDSGFRPEGVLSMKLALPNSSYDSSAVRNFLQTATVRLRAIPGVQLVGLADAVPLDGTGNDFSFRILGQTYARPSDQPNTDTRLVHADFFKTLGIPLLRGRLLAEGDGPTAPRVYVVNAAFERAFFPHDGAIGKQIHLGWGNDPPQEYMPIVGVVGDVHDVDLGADPKPTVYAAFMQYPQHSVTLLLRTSGAPASVAAPARAIVRDIDRELPVYSVLPMEQRVAESVGPQRFYATLIAIFASVALVLTAVGLYGVIAYAVSQRTHELGVRVALGATTDRIARMVVGEGLMLTVIGLVLGIAGSIASGQLLSTLLFGVSGRDPLTLAGVVAVLGVVAMLASWLPARRAARVDPLVAMRGD